jgi:adenylylsulfate kinase
MKNLHQYEKLINQQDREARSGHRSFIMWFTGLSGAGKSTVSHAVEKALFEAGCNTFVLDGDSVRHGLCSDLSFSDDARRENIRRVGEVSKLLNEAGVITLTAFISPFREDRNHVRSIVEDKQFVEVYCNASLEVCETRDVKGLYKKARLGEIKDFTGISSPYEAPINPELEVNTGLESLDECVSKIMAYLASHGYIKLNK